jgi:hypothetical protein
VRTFGRAAALHPVPFARKIVQALASASIMLSCFETNVIDKPAAPACNSARRRAICGQPTFFLPVNTARKTKKPCLDLRSEHGSA